MSAPNRPAGGLPTVPLLPLCIAIGSWASAYPLIRLALVYLSPVPLAAVRYAVAALFLVPWLVATRAALPKGADIPRFLLCGGVGIALYNFLLNTGERTVSAGAASLLINIAPFLAAIVAVLFMGESLTLLGWVGSVISFAGVVLIGSGQPGGFSFGSGATYVLGGAVCSAVYYLLQKPLILRYGALPTTAWNLLAGALVLLPWLPQGMGQLHGQGAYPWVLVAILSLVPAIAGYAAWAKVVGRVGVAASSGFLYLLAPTTLVLAFFMTAEVPSLTTLLGGAVVMGGVALMQLYGRPSPTPLPLPDGEG